MLLGGVNGVIPNGCNGDTLFLGGIANGDTFGFTAEDCGVPIKFLNGVNKFEKGFAMIL